MVHLTLISIARTINDSYIIFIVKRSYLRLSTNVNHKLIRREFNKVVSFLSLLSDLVNTNVLHSHEQTML